MQVHYHVHEAITADPLHRLSLLTYCKLKMFLLLLNLSLQSAALARLIIHMTSSVCCCTFCLSFAAAAGIDGHLQHGFLSGLCTFDSGRAIAGCGGEVPGQVCPAGWFHQCFVSCVFPTQHVSILPSILQDAAVAFCDTQLGVAACLAACCSAAHILKCCPAMLSCNSGGDVQLHLCTV